jgi:hypothetical protein
VATLIRGAWRLSVVQPLADRRFRCGLAALLLVIGALGLGALLVHQASLPLAQGQFGIDFHDYRIAAQRMGTGDVPYAPAMLEGPVPAQGIDRYRYPPILAQALVPISGLPLQVDNVIWLAIQLAFTYGGTWVAGTAGGLRRSPERALWTGVACVWYLPLFQTLWMGNVSGIVAGLVGFATVPAPRSGGWLASIGLLKGTTGIAASIALFRGRRMAAAAVVTSGLLIALSVAVSPAAWVDYWRVLPNLIAGSASYATNLAPDQLLAHALPAARPVAPLIRILAVALGTGALLSGCLLARRSERWGQAVILAVVASLLIPSSLWYHYLAALLPLAALAWGKAVSRDRVGLFGGVALICMGIAALWIALLGAVVTVAFALSGASARADSERLLVGGIPSPG